MLVLKLSLKGQVLSEIVRKDPIKSGGLQSIEMKHYLINDSLLLDNLLSAAQYPASGSKLSSLSRENAGDPEPIYLSSFSLTP